MRRDGRQRNADGEMGHGYSGGIPYMLANGDLLCVAETGPIRDISAWRQATQRIITLKSVVAAALSALILLAVPRTIADPDIWWHLRNAQIMLQQHVFVRHDLYSFSIHGVPWIDHEWLAELPYYLGWHLAGAAGLFAVGAALVVAIFAALFWLCSQQTHNMVAAATATLGAALLATVSFGPRTLLLGWLAFCIQQVVLQRFRQGHGRAVLLLPPLYVLWVNLHGSWLLGLGVLVVAAVAGQMQLRHHFLYTARFSVEQNRALLLAGCGILPALFCNPWGWRLVAYPFNFAFRQTLNVASIEEWRSLDFHSVRGEVVVAAVLLVMVRQLWKPRAWTLDEVLLFAGSLFAACLHARFLFLFALLGAPCVARSFGRKATIPTVERTSGSLLVNALLLVLIALFTATNLHKQAATQPQISSSFPLDALPALDGLRPGTRLLNEFGWGGFLEWNRPGLPIFIDSRTDIFEYNDVLRDYLDIIRIKDPLRLLDSYRIDAVLFEQDTPLTYVLARAPEWRIAWSDTHSVLFHRLPLRPALDTQNGRASLTGVTR